MAMPLNIGAAHAATMLTFDPGSYETVPPVPPFPSPFQGTTGTLYITGTGNDVVSSINSREEQVSVEGTGLFAGFDGLATYQAVRTGQIPNIVVTLVNAGLTYELQFMTTTRIPDVVFDQVFTEQEAPSSSNLSGSPFEYLAYSVTDSNDNGYAAFDNCSSTSFQTCPSDYNIVSNTAIVAPTPTPVATTVPEPSTLALLAGSLSLTGLFARRRGVLNV